MDNRKPSWKRNDTNNRVNEEFQFSPIEVEVRNNDIEAAIRELRHKISKDGILTELKKHKHAEKPSDKKRREHREAIRKMKKTKGRRQNYNRDKK